MSPFFHMPRGYDLEHGVFFPCGNCPSCRANQAEVWALRLQLEAVQHKDICIALLTYDQEHLPENETLVKAHAVNFMKRLRTALVRAGYDKKIRYYICGEYGEKFNRPHYHAIIYGLPQEYYHLVALCWPYGMSNAELPVDTMNACYYIAGYVTKKIGALKNNARYVDKLPEFHLSSRGLGLKTFVEQVISRGVFSTIIEVNGYKKYVGRYLRNKAAEHFGILEDVKKQGIALLASYAEEIFTVAPRFYNSLDMHPAIKKYFRRRSRDYYKQMYQFYYKGEIDHYNAKLKLKKTRHKD